MLSTEFLEKLQQDRLPVSMDDLVQASGRDRFYWARVRAFLRDVANHDPSLLRVGRLLGVPVFDERDTERQIAHTIRTARSPRGQL